MPMNTEYLSMNTSAQSNINTPYTNVGVTSFSNTSSAGTMWVNDFVVRGSYTTSGAVVFGSTMSVGGAATLDSTLSVGGLATFTSAVTVRGLLNLNSQRTQAGLISYLTTASATSAILPDGAFGVYFHSGNSCRLCFRSGATTYTIIATTGGVL